jgi:hypothetical protein
MMTGEQQRSQPRRRCLRAMSVATCAGALCVALADSDVASGQLPAAAGADAKAMVIIEAVGTQRSGATGRPRTWSDRRLGVDEVMTQVLLAGSSNSGDVCDAAFAPEGQQVDALVTWHFDIRPLSVSPDAVRLQVRWMKTANGNPQAGAEQSRQVVLRPGEHTVLDYIENRPDSASPCASLLVRLSAESPVQPAAFKTADVDIWLVEEQDGRAVRSVYERVAGTVGAELAFQLFQFDYAITADGDDSAVHLGVSGTLRVVLASDGTFSISANAWRKFQYGSSWARGEGRVEVRAPIGTTAALVLPIPRGHLSGPSPRAGHLLPGAVEQADSVLIDVGELLRGRNLALYVRLASVR